MAFLLTTILLYSCTKTKFERRLARDINGYHHLAGWIIKEEWDGGTWVIKDSTWLEHLKISIEVMNENTLKIDDNYEMQRRDPDPSFPNAYFYERPPYKKYAQGPYYTKIYIDEGTKKIIWTSGSQSGPEYKRYYLWEL